MTKRPARVREREATSLLKAARAAGYLNPRLEVEVDGKYVLFAEDRASPAAPANENAEPANPWDEALD